MKTTRVNEFKKLVLSVAVGLGMEPGKLVQERGMAEIELADPYLSGFWLLLVELQKHLGEPLRVEWMAGDGPLPKDAIFPFAGVELRMSQRPARKVVALMVSYMR